MYISGMIARWPAVYSLLTITNQKSMSIQFFIHSAIKKAEEIALIDLEAIENITISLTVCLMATSSNKETL